MPVEVILPKVDMDMTHGTLAVWHVAEGDSVAKGAPLFDIETDKAAMEVEAPASGILQHISAKPGDKVAVGSVVAWIYAAGEAVGTAPAGQLTEQVITTEIAAVDVSVPPPAAPVPDTPQPTRTKPRATPAARKAAAEGGLDLNHMTGTGPLGRIQLDNVNARPGSRAEPPYHWSPDPGPLHVIQRKGTGIPVLFLHGFSADSLSWVPLERALRTARPVIKIDLPGHGKSPKRRIVSFAALARMLVEAFDDTTQDPVHIVGHSLGAALALALADIRGRQVASLSLIAPAGLGPEIDGAALTGIARATRVDSLAPWLRRLTATPEGISDEYARAAMVTRTDPQLRTCQADMAGALFPDGVQGFSLTAALERLTCPTQIIWGRQDQIIPWRQALTPRTDFALHLLDQAGHIPQIECPDRVARIILGLAKGA